LEAAAVMIVVHVLIFICNVLFALFLFFICNLLPYAIFIFFIFIILLKMLVGFNETYASPVLG
jgi:hypothetical protein